MCSVTGLEMVELWEVSPTETEAKSVGQHTIDAVIDFLGGVAGMMTRGRQNL